MNCYFEEGEVFTWIRDRERSGENMVVSLKMLKECHRTGSKQAMIAEDIRTEKKYFVKVLFCNDLEQVYVEKESKVQLYSPYIIRIYGGMLDEKNKRFITLVEYIEESDLSELMRGKGIAGDTWNEKMRVRNRIAMKFLYGIDHYMSFPRGAGAAAPRRFGGLFYVQLRRHIQLLRCGRAVLFALAHALGQKIFYLPVDRAEVILRPRGDCVVQLRRQAQRHLLFRVVRHISTACRS